MSDQGVLFLISVAALLGSLGVAVWLAITGQVAYLDGIFLLASCLVVALAFGLYLKSMLRRAIGAAPAPGPKTRAASAAPKADAGQPAAVGSTEQSA